jgi:hypothetical protein
METTSLSLEIILQLLEKLCMQWVVVVQDIQIFLKILKKANIVIEKTEGVTFNCLYL